MRGWVVFESMFGNTGVVAERVAEGLREYMVAELFEVSAAPPFRMKVWSCWWSVRPRTVSA